MLRHIAGFEWRYQVRSPVFWIGCLIFFLLTFGSVTVDQVQIGSRGNVHINAPFAILQTLSIMSLFTGFIVVAMVAGVVIRDDETGFAPILRSTRVGKWDYLVGRFAGAVAAALLVMAVIPLAIAIGVLMPWQDPEKIGPFRLSDYLTVLFGFGLPTLLITAAVFFALATATRSLMWTYVGAAAMLVLYIVMRSLLRDTRFDAVTSLLDPYGQSAIAVATRYWTAAERNAQLPPLSGALLANRLLWSGVGLALFALAAWRFRYAERAGSAAASADDEPVPARRSAATLPAPRADAATRRAQLWALARFDMAFVFRSPTFFVLLLIGLINAGAACWFSGELYGSPSYPVTRLMIEALNGAFTIMPILIAIYYGGDLVWRDRERRMHEIVDATAAPDWAHLAPKIVAITLVLLATGVVAALSAAAVQLLKGYTAIDAAAYALWYVLPTTVAALLLAVLSVFVQVLVSQKFIGWALMLLQLVASIALASAGFEHNLYNYAGTPPVPLSDMNRLGHFWIGAWWLLAYWSAFATILAVLAYALWRRGATVALRPRLAQLKLRLRGPALALLVVATVAWIGLGVWVYVNTNVINRYVTAPQREQLAAEMEKTLLPFEQLSHPRITAVTVDVQLYPRETRALTSGRYTIDNPRGVPISDVHVQWGERTRLDAFDLAGATLKQEWPLFHYRIYTLATPLAPGESRELTFRTTLEERGFTNGAPLTRVVENGTFIDNSEITPSFGPQRDPFLKERSKRRKHGLAPDLRPPKLEDDGARVFSGFRHDSDFVRADITVTTDADQAPIAPGQTVSERVADGRRTVHFVPDAPINHFYSIQSARYAVERDVWKGKQGDVALAVYYHPDHPYNVARMLQAMKLSLQMFGERFSTFQFKQARVLEFPAYATFAQSFANTIPYSEAIGFIAHPSDDTKIDMVTYVTAHEIAHQWWGHQLVPADQQGATMLVETFAQYSALLVMERMYGKDQIRRFLKYELDRYLRARGGEVVEELPLARVENQPYIHYNKGSLAMYWLKDVVGEAVVDRALAALLQRYAFKVPPYPNPRDFLAILREQAGPQHDALITDLFERITLLDLKTLAATTRALPDGRHALTLEIEAHKRYADGKGEETEAPLDEEIDVGAFSVEPGKTGFAADSVLALSRRRIVSGKQTLTLTLDKAPAWAGIDPYNKRIDRNSEDNLKAVSAQP
ncbi:MAG TPA: M1 family aminopeptidase [Burkholderiaceae bacterium]|nr:M1 family aminopeptidase [Burkholderiaceae bacterium]